MEIPLTFMGYGHTKLPTKVVDRTRFSVTLAAQYEEKVTEGNGFIALELLNFQEIGCLVQDGDNSDPPSKNHLPYFPITKYTNNYFLGGEYEG